MEEWVFIDDEELQGLKRAFICMTCEHFTYGVDQHCTHAAWLHAQAKAAATGSASEEEVQAMGTKLAERNGMGTRSWLRTTVAAAITPTVALSFLRVTVQPA